MGQEVAGRKGGGGVGVLWRERREGGEGGFDIYGGFSCLIRTCWED